MMTIDTVHIQVRAIRGPTSLRHLAGLDLVNEVAEVDISVTYSHGVPREVVE
jgi:hypothetical protein